VRLSQNEALAYLEVTVPGGRRPQLWEKNSEPSMYLMSVN